MKANRFLRRIEFSLFIHSLNSMNLVLIFFVYFTYVKKYLVKFGKSAKKLHHEEIANQINSYQA